MREHPCLPSLGEHCGECHRCTPPARPSVVCQREPERSFCSDCPDHEACSTGVPESLVRAPQTPLERQYEVAVKRNRGLDRFSLAPRRKGSQQHYTKDPGEGVCVGCGGDYPECDRDS